MKKKNNKRGFKRGYRGNWRKRQKEHKSQEQLVDFIYFDFDFIISIENKMNYFN